MEYNRGHQPGLPTAWEVAVDPTKNRWDRRTPSGDALLDEDGMFILDETGATVLEGE